MTDFERLHPFATHALVVHQSASFGARFFATVKQWLRLFDLHQKPCNQSLVQIGNTLQALVTGADSCQTN
ncbi:hypothetical protein [Aliiroseovarius subalbicans]|uniref:hypothetical protein n=1 Tax=Aliiroseovarius subalbicans TaxID=2925840 RepID=UPI001F562911|nr:hypothetical protein [Aliiroseovarius subalbicans]